MVGRGGVPKKGLGWTREVGWGLVMEIFDGGDSRGAGADIILDVSREKMVARWL